ncbi:UDP-glycosyltransferase family, conserved site [Sesbania bispinosa]|nr:UDP-glycosyltransferase family, conserved site [Sesbania bispinosa]
MEVHKQPHVVLLSSPGLGHLMPVIELAKRFILHHNFKATILAVTSESSDAEKHILKSSITPSLCNIIQIPSPDISALVPIDAAVVACLCITMREAVPSIRSALIDMPLRPSALIVDFFGTEALPVAEELNIPKFVYVASNAWFLSLLVYSPVLDKQIEGQYVNQKEPLQIPGCNPVRPEDVIDPMLDRNDLQYQEYLTLGRGILKSDGVLVNTWEELQRKDLEGLRDENFLGRVLKVPVYAVGPIVRQPVWETDSATESVVKWLDKQPMESVVYVSFGSGGTVSSEQMREIAWGLELSQQRFVWVVRAPIDGAADAAYFTAGRGDGFDKIWKQLPEGFVERTKKIGLLVPQWAPQVTILRHRSMGGFLSHCGWGSTLESITNSVPMIAWPLYGEQRMNATLLAEELGVAVRTKVLPTKKLVGREEIARMVREVIQVDHENGRSNHVRERVREINGSAEKALSQSGSSFAALSQVAKIIGG